MAPRLLFVPVSGAGGAGEFMRSLIIAREAHRRWLDAHIHFVVNAAAGYARELEFPCTTVDGSPTYNVRVVNEVIGRERPHVVVFDSAGRVAQYRCARAQGAAVVYVSSRPKTRWKGFRLRRMRYLDQHWLAQPRFLGGDLSRWERCKLWLMRRPQTVFLDAVFESFDSSLQSGLLQSLNLVPDSYVVLCIGSGGRYSQVQDATRVVLAAAQSIQREAGLRCVVVSGSNAPAMPSNEVRCIPTLPNGELMSLLAAARVAVVNGGSLLLQAIGNRVPAVAVPVAGDQADRIRRCAALGLVLPSELAAATISRDVITLLRDEPSRGRLLAAMSAVDMNSGVASALQALERLLPPADHHRPTAANASS